MRRGGPHLLRCATVRLRALRDTIFGWVVTLMNCAQEPVTDSQLADKKQAFKRGATTFVIFYPYTIECSYEWFRPGDLKLFDPCQL